MSKSTSTCRTPRPPVRGKTLPPTYKSPQKMHWHPPSSAADVQKSPKSARGSRDARDDRIRARRAPAEQARTLRYAPSRAKETNRRAGSVRRHQSPSARRKRRGVRHSRNGGARCRARSPKSEREAQGKAMQVAEKTAREPGVRQMAPPRDQVGFGPRRVAHKGSDGVPQGLAAAACSTVCQNGGTKRCQKRPQRQTAGRSPKMERGCPHPDPGAPPPPRTIAASEILRLRSPRGLASLRMTRGREVLRLRSPRGLASLRMTRERVPAGSLRSG